MRSIELEAKDFRNIIAATFPGYRKRKVYLNARGSVTFTGLNWSGGSRSEYQSCTLEGRPLGNMNHHNQVAPWDQVAEGKSVEIPRGACVVEGGHFCGKQSTLRIYIHPDDMPRYLPTAMATAHAEIEARKQV
jgi:hypothetical protein